MIAHFDKDEWVHAKCKEIEIILRLFLKVSKYQKQNTKFYHPPKNQQNFVHFFALASKKWFKQKIKALDYLNYTLTDK